MFPKKHSERPINISLRTYFFTPSRLLISVTFSNTLTYSSAPPTISTPTLLYYWRSTSKAINNETNERLTKYLQKENPFLESSCNLIKKTCSSFTRKINLNRKRNHILKCKVRTPLITATITPLKSRTNLKSNIVNDTNDMSKSNNEELNQKKIVVTEENNRGI